MALSGDTLGTKIAQDITVDGCPEDAKEEIERLWKLIANDIINHITSNAVVTVAAGIAVSTAGSATAQTGATTSTGTGTIA